MPPGDFRPESVGSGKQAEPGNRQGVTVASEGKDFFGGYISHPFRRQPISEQAFTEVGQAGRVGGKGAI